MEPIICVDFDVGDIVHFQFHRHFACSFDGCEVTDDLLSLIRLCQSFLGFEFACALTVALNATLYGYVANQLPCMFQKQRHNMQ